MFLKCDLLFVEEMCGTPKHVENGNFVYCSEFGESIVTYSCQHGFLLQGEEQLICTNKGWNFQAPVCIGISLDICICFWFFLKAHLTLFKRSVSFLVLKCIV